MAIEIHLDAVSYDALLECVPENSAAFPPLGQAIKIEKAPLTLPHFVIVCSLEEAFQLLREAKQDCPGAVHAIELGIKLSQPKSA